MVSVVLPRALAEMRRRSLPEPVSRELPSMPHAGSKAPARVEAFRSTRSLPEPVSRELSRRAQALVLWPLARAEMRTRSLPEPVSRDDESRPMASAYPRRLNAAARTSTRSLLLLVTMFCASTAVLETEAWEPMLRLKALAMKFMVVVVSGACALELIHHRRNIASFC